jgi:hypothetical protein
VGGPVQRKGWRHRRQGKAALALLLTPGVLSAQLDSDGDTVVDSVECPGGAFVDTDGDGIGDYHDTDDDGDGTLTRDEITPYARAPRGRSRRRRPSSRQVA